MSESFKDKIVKYEVQPPAAAWQSIAQDLISNNEMLSISNKLFDYEAVPPPDSWNTIINTLDNNQSVVINMAAGKRSKRFLTLAILAAAILIGIVFSVTYLDNQNPEITKSALTVIPNKSKLHTEARKSVPPPAQVASKPDQQDPAKLPAPSYARINKSFASGKVLQQAKVQSRLFPGNELGIMIAARPIRNENGEIIQNPEILNKPGSKYISITAPNGEQTKISSKFLHLLLFLNDANDIDQVDGYFDKKFLESLIWKSRFQDWRNEIISTSFVPSSTNFMDIFELKELIMKDRQ